MSCARRALLFLLVLLPAAVRVAPVRADHRDGPTFEGGADPSDIGELYVFESPETPTDTVIVMTVGPFAGGPNGTPTTFRDDAIYDVRIATGNVLAARDDVTFRVTFGPPDGNGVQDVLLRVLPAARFGSTGVLAKGKTNQNVPMTGGGLFRAGVQDDPYFFDEAGFAAFLDGGTFPRAAGVAVNRYGPNANVLALVLEIPTAQLGVPGALIGVWGRVAANGVQLDRAGRPLVNEGVVPPVPRGGSFPIGTGGVDRQERRDAFNAGHPKDDVADFTADVEAVLEGFYGRTPGDAATVAGELLPDLLVFQLGNASGFGTMVTDATGATPGTLLGNGRRLPDDAVDAMLSLLTNGAKTTDAVGDDNGSRLTDGSPKPGGGTRFTFFPYIGAPNASPSGLP